MIYLYSVATKKEVLVTIRIAENVRDEFKMAAELRGATMSGLMHQFITRTIREEKQLSPDTFAAPHGGKKLASHSRDKMPIQKERPLKKKAA